MNLSTKLHEGARREDWNLGIRLLFDTSGQVRIDSISEFGFQTGGGISLRVVRCEHRGDYGFSLAFVVMD